MSDIPTDVPMTNARKKELSNRPFAMIYPQMMRNINDNCCAWCGEPISAKSFSSASTIEKREYNISGTCLKCQRKTFSNGKSPKNDMDDSDLMMEDEEFEC